MWHGFQGVSKKFTNVENESVFPDDKGNQMPILSSKFNRLLFFVIVLLSPSCTRDRNPFSPADVIPETFYWSEPKEECFVLAFRITDSLWVDDLDAGKIQFALDVARTLDTQLVNIFPGLPAFALGELLIAVSDTLYYNFNETTFRFGSDEIDSLLNIYNPVGFKKDHVYPWNEYYSMTLYFLDNYNMPILSDKFDGLPGIHYSSADWWYPFNFGPPFHISLEINDSDFLFDFFTYYFSANLVHYWKIRVEKDIPLLLEEGEDTYYP